MLDITGDRGVLKDVIREGTGDLVTPDASVLGMGAGLSCVLGLHFLWREGGHVFFVVFNLLIFECAL